MTVPVRRGAASREEAARLNPFRAERVESLRFRFAGEDWPAARRRLETLGWRGAIVGPEGSGKTTLLLELAARLEAEGRAVRLLLADGRTRVGPAEFEALATAVRQTPGAVLLDGADRFSALQWWRLRRAARGTAGLVTTLHCAGRWPTWLTCAPSPGLFVGLVGELLGHEGGPGFVSRVELEHLFARHGGNVRAALRALYDRWAAGHTAGPA